MVVRMEGWTCHVSNGGVLCEAATCSFRGGPYNPFPEVNMFQKDKKFKKHLKMLKKKASETLSQFSDFSSDDDDDAASSTFLGDLNEDVLWTSIHTLGLTSPSLLQNPFVKILKNGILAFVFDQRSKILLLAILRISWQDLKGSQVFQRIKDSFLIFCCGHQYFQIQVG